MKKTLQLLICVFFFLQACVEKEDAQQVEPDDTLFFKIKIDGVDYEYSYKLKEDYLSGESPDLSEWIPQVGLNHIILSNERLEVDIQHGCNKTSGKKACIGLAFQSLSIIGRNTDPFFSGVIPGDTFRYMERNYSNFNDQPMDFEVILKNYDASKATVEGTFKGKARLFVQSENPETKIIDIEGSFRAGAIL